MRYYLSIKNVVELELYRLPSDLEQAVANSIAYYNEERYHEAGVTRNVSTADVYFGRAERILNRREAIKQRRLAAQRGLARPGQPTASP